MQLSTILVCAYLAAARADVGCEGIQDYEIHRTRVKPLCSVPSAELTRKLRGLCHCIL